MFTALHIAAVCGGTVKGNEKAVSGRVTTDSRNVSEGDLFFAICGEKFDGNAFAKSAMEKGANIAVVSDEKIEPEEGKCVIVVKDTSAALLALASDKKEKSNVKLVAITGSVGKTTTKEMCACALAAELEVHKTKGNFNNEIGMPLTLFALEDKHEVAVVEMGMNHFGEIERLSRSARPDVAMITNIGLSHIENLGSMENILKAKLEIVCGMKEGGVLILNGDDPLLKKVKLEGFKIITYGFGEDCDVRGEILSENSVKVLGEEITLSISGEHNLQNACGAMALAKELGLSPCNAARGIEKFETDNIRQSITKSEKGFYIISDYYNASPQSVDVALKMLSKKQGKKIAVLADMLELGDYSKESHIKIGKLAAEYNMDLLLCYGKACEDTYKAAKDSGVEAKHFSDKEELGEFLVEILKEGDYVLIKGSRGMKLETVYEKITR